MARRPRASRLETRTARLKLPIRINPHDYTQLAPGISLGYRRCKGPGRWQVRVADGEGGYWFSVIGIADDHEAADGEHVLDWFGAQDRARAVARGSEDRDDKPATLAEALDTYERDLEARGANVA